MKLFRIFILFITHLVVWQLIYGHTFWMFHWLLTNETTYNFNSILINGLFIYVIGEALEYRIKEAIGADNEYEEKYLK